MSRSIPYLTSKPRRLGCLFQKHFSWSLGSSRLPSVSSYWLEQHRWVAAPLEAIAFMLLQPPLPHHVIFHFDSQYVIDLLLGLSLPSTNSGLAILLLDYYHYLSSLSCVELRKVKSHTGIPGNDRADLNATKGLSSCTSIGRFATFPPLDLPSQTWIHLQQRLTLSKSFKLSLPPPKPPLARKPYISSATISLISQLPHTTSTELKPRRNKTKESFKLKKKRRISSNLHTDYIGSPSEHWRTIKRVRSTIQIPTSHSVRQPPWRHLLP